MKPLKSDNEMKASVTVEPLAIDLKNASVRCGYSVKTLRRAIDAGELVAVQATAKIVVMMEDLRRYLERHKIVPASSVAKPVNKKVAMPKLACGGQARTRKSR